MTNKATGYIKNNKLAIEDILDLAAAYIEHGFGGSDYDDIIYAESGMLAKITGLTETIVKAELYNRILK
jgi:hypothetical protein